MKLLGLFSDGPDDQTEDNRHGDLKNKQERQARLDNDRILLKAAEKAEREGRHEDARHMRRLTGD